jgi:hypothetical protein
MYRYAYILMFVADGTLKWKNLVNHVVIFLIETSVLFWVYGDAKNTRTEQKTDK